ncbi:MAG: hypothetical protein M3305_01070 [Actinomycetota bacterium]|nr:hypothetical protein [Actinomycetota bacterium]
MQNIAKRRKRQTVAHNVFDDRGFTTVVEPVGVPPEAIGTVQLLIYKPDRWLPV